MGYQSEASNDIGVGTSVNYGNNAIGVDIAGGGFGADTSDTGKKPDDFGFPLFKLPSGEGESEKKLEPNPAEAYANDYATNTNRAGQQSLTESQKAIRGWVSPIPGSIGTQEGALARTRGAGTPASTPTSNAYVNNARDYSSINNMNALGSQAQEANKNAYGSGTRDYSSLPPTLSSQFANWGQRSAAQEHHNATNGYMGNLSGHAEHPTHSWAENSVDWLGNQLGKLGEPLGSVVEAVENIPNNIDTLYQRYLGSPQGSKSGTNTAVTGGAGAAATTGSNVAITAVGLDIANQLLQIYYDD